jgi:hypothetical protein
VQRTVFVEIPEDAGRSACQHDQHDDPDQQAAHLARL